MTDVFLVISEYINTAENFDNKVNRINSLRKCIHKLSPFIDNPVDFIEWIPSSTVLANDYNPNVVAPPEMELLKLSIEADGYTQPIVVWNNGEACEVIDGFHRSKIGKENESIKNKVHGYLPITAINTNRIDRSDRIASTIRHNRARGKHVVSSMSDIVVELKHRNWSDERIAKEIGMDADEVLRLCQISGIRDLFTNQDFSEAWEARLCEGEDTGDIIFEDNAEDIPSVE